MVVRRVRFGVRDEGMVGTEVLEMLAVVNGF